MEVRPPTPMDALPERPVVPRDLAVMWDDSPTTGLSLLQHGLQRALADLGVPVVRRWRLPGAYRAAQIAAKAGVSRPIVPAAWRERRRSITVLSWASGTRTFPDTLWREIVPWIFDCWGPQFEAWEALLKRHRARVAFFSARDAAAHFASVIPGLTAHWLPEACDPALFHPERPLASRSIHVLELGRKHAALHERIREPLARAGVTHRFAIDGTRTPIFSTLDDTYRALGDTAIMACFPKTITHPSEAGGVETMTQRYLEAIGSGCVCYGRAPRELVDLFGFNPVVEMDEQDPAGQVMRLMEEIRRGEHQELVDLARARLPEVGTFGLRARQMVSAL